MAKSPWTEEPIAAVAQRPRSLPVPRSGPRLDLQDALSVLWLRKWSILFVTLVMVGVALLVSSQQVPVYESQASVLVMAIDTGTGSVVAGPNLATEAELVSSVAIAKIVINDLGIEIDPSTLLGNLSVDQPTGTEILKMSYRDADPALARRVATGFAQGYLEFRQAAASKVIVESGQKLQGQIDALQRRLRDLETELLGLSDNDPGRGSLEAEAAAIRNLILQTQIARLSLPRDVTGGQIIQPASLPTAPVSPNHVVNGLFGLAAGLALGIGQALIRDRMSGRLRSSEELEEYLEAPVLAVIPKVPNWRRRKRPYLVSVARWRSPAAEAYRVLRTNVLSATAAVGAKSIVVTSAHKGEGKSATVANLGVVLARAGKRVSLVSADLRRPRLHEFFSLEEGPGLSEVLGGRSPLQTAVQEVELPFSAPMDLSAVTLRILPSGHVPADPAELLSSPTMVRVLQDLEETSDIVLIDAPPILPFTDAPMVAAMAKSVLLVIGPNSSTQSTILSARQQLDRAGARVLGGVLNGPDAIRAQSFGY